jgi:hypothetical protein
MLLILLLLGLSPKFAGSIVVRTDEDDDFVLGKFWVCPQMRNPSYSDDILKLLLSCDGITHSAVLPFFSARNMSIYDYSQRAISTPTMREWSHAMNLCSAKDESWKALWSTASCSSGHGRKEIILHAALSLWPGNIIVIKNLVFYLEWEGHIPTAKALMQFVRHLLVLNLFAVIICNRQKVKGSMQALQSSAPSYVRRYSHLTHMPWCPFSIFC